MEPDPVSFLGGAKSQSVTPTRLNAIALNQSTYGNAVALVYGKTRIGINLGWYGNFTAIPVRQSGGGKGGGGGSTSSYTYSAAVIMFLCEGPIAAIGQVWKDKAITTISAEGLTLFTGAGGQATWSYLTTNFPTQAIPYDHTAYVADGNLDLGGSASLPNYSFEVTGFCSFGGGIVDAEPSAILVDYTTDANHGCHFPYLDSGIQGAGNTYQSYCIAMGLFFSPQETTQRSAVDFINELLKATNSAPVWSGGVLKIIPYADTPVTGHSRTYTPDLSPEYDFFDTDYLDASQGGGSSSSSDPVQVSITPANETFNKVRVEFLDRANAYNVAIAEATDDNDIALNGERTMQTVSLHGITTAAVALQVAHLILWRQLYIRSTFTFSVRADYCLLEPMDFVAINDVDCDIVNQLVRITQIDESADDPAGTSSDMLTITAEEMLVGPALPPIYDTQAAQGYAANYNVDPGSIQTPLIFAAPPLLVDPNGGYQLWIAACGQNIDPWGGCDVHQSLDGGTTYAYVGTIAGPARYGTLTASLATGVDPDVTHTLSVQLDDTSLQMASGTVADADNLRTLIYVDGEVMAYETATLTGAGAYNLTYLRRGQYGTDRAAHSSSTAFARIDEALLRVPYDPGMVGQTLYFKFPSFNYVGGGVQDISAVSAYTYTITAANAGQLQANATTLVGRGVAVVGTKAFKSAATSAWDSDCYSKESYTNGAFVNFRASQVNASLILGLGSNPTLDSSYTSVNYAWEAHSSGTSYIYESGVSPGSYGTYTANDVFSIIYDGKMIRYFKSGTLMRQIPAPPGLTLYLDSSFYDPGAAANNISFGPYGAVQAVPYIARGNCRVSDLNVTKSGGSSAWDSDCFSVDTFPICHVSWKCNQTNANLMIGLGLSPAFDQSYTSIDYAIYCDVSGIIEIYESGTQVVANAGAYTTATLFGVTYNGSTVTYLADGVVLRTVTIASLALYMDSSFYTPGGGVNSLRFGPTTNLEVLDTPQIGQNAATVTYLSTLNTGGTITVPASTVHDPTKVINSIIVTPAPAFDCKVILTVTIKMDQTAGSVGDLSLYSFYYDGSTFTYSTVDAFLSISATPEHHLTMQWQFDHNHATGSATIGIGVSNNSGSSRSANFEQGYIQQLEFIKR
jgi:hypothetical protein